MRKGFLGTMATLLTGAGLAMGQGVAAKAKPGSARITSDEVVQAEGSLLPVNSPVVILPNLGPVPGAGEPTDISGYGGPGMGMPGMGMPGMGGPGMGMPGMGGPGMGGPMYPPPSGLEGYGDPGLAAGGDGGGIDKGRAVPKVWSRLDFLLWAVKSQNVNYPILTTGSPSSRGILNSGGGVGVLIGQQDISYNMSTGFRVTTGFWCEPNRRVGFELSGFSIGQTTNRQIFETDAGGGPLLARPFVNAANGVQSSILVTSPGIANGGVVFQTSNRLYGAEGDLVVNLFRSNPTSNYYFTSNALFGARFINLDETMQQFSSSTSGTFDLANTFGPQSTVAGSAFTTDILDQVRVKNQFYGGQIGLQNELRMGRLVLGGNFKLALGNMAQRVDIAGSTRLSVITPNSTVVTPGPFFPTTTVIPASTASGAAVGGVYANAGSIGKYRHDEFAAVPEFNLSVGYQLTPHILGTIGYNYLYLNNVARPGNIDLTRINPGLIPSSPNFGNTIGPAFRPDVFRQTDFWSKGATVTLVFSY